MKRAVVAVAILMTAGCVAKSEQVCSGTVNIAGVDQQVKIFGVKEQVGRTLVKAGYPFSFRWVSIENFKSTTCKVNK